MYINTENPFHLNKLKSLVALFMNFQTFLKQQQNIQKNTQILHHHSHIIYYIIYTLYIFLFIYLYNKPSKPQVTQI